MWISLLSCCLGSLSAVSRTGQENVLQHRPSSEPETNTNWMGHNNFISVTFSYGPISNINCQLVIWAIAWNFLVLYATDSTRWPQTTRLCMCFTPDFSFKQLGGMGQSRSLHVLSNLHLTRKTLISYITASLLTSVHSPVSFVTCCCNCPQSFDTLV